MERIKHIKETSVPIERGYSETDRVRPEINQDNKYDQATETMPEQIAVRESINSLDEELLRGIFAEFFRKAGSLEPTMNWIPFKDVRIVHKTPKERAEAPSTHGAYSMSNGIRLYSDVLAKRPGYILWALIHEECHAVSKDKPFDYFDTSDNGEETVNVVSRSGVSTRRITFKTEDKDMEDTEDIEDNDNINEGVTELLTEKIFLEYKRRSGLTRYKGLDVESYEKISDTEQMVSTRKLDSYGRYWQNARLYIGIIAAVSGIPKDVVEGAVIRTYLRNGCLEPGFESEESGVFSQIDPLLNLVTYDMLNSCRANFTLNDFVNSINSQDVPIEIKQKISKALKDIKEEWGEAYKKSPESV